MMLVDISISEKQRFILIRSNLEETANNLLRGKGIHPNPVKDEPQGNQFKDT